MRSQEAERARVLAAFTDDLLADREPTLSAEAATLFTPEELAEAVSSARFLKGLLRPSGLDPTVEADMRARLVERMRAARSGGIAGVGAAVALPVLLAERRRHAGLSTMELAVRAGLDERELASLESDSVPFISVPPERLINLGLALAVPMRQLLQAVQMSAAQWLPRLTGRGIQRGLAGFHAKPGLSAATNRVAARREAAETLAEYLARLERLAKEQELF